MKEFLAKRMRWATGCLVLLTFCACGSDEAENVDLKWIRDRKELGVAEFNFHKIIVERKTTDFIRVAGHGIGSYTQRPRVIPVDLTVFGSIDCSGVTNDNLIRNGDELIFVLPDPDLRIQSCEADYEAMEKYSNEGWWNGSKYSDEEIQAAVSKAKDSIIIERVLSLMAEQTRANAFDVLRPIISLATGVEEDKIKVQFDSQLDISKAELKDGRIIVFRKEEQKQ